MEKSVYFDVSSLSPKKPAVAVLSPIAPWVEQTFTSTFISLSLQEISTRNIKPEDHGIREQRKLPLNPKHRRQPNCFPPHAGIAPAANSFGNQIKLKIEQNAGKAQMQ